MALAESYMLELLEAWKKDGDCRAIEAVLNRYMPAIRAIVGKYTRNKRDKHIREDLLQEGIYIFLRAAKRFDPSKSKATLLTYTWRSVDRGVQRYIESNIAPIQLSLPLKMISTDEDIEQDDLESVMIDGDFRDKIRKVCEYAVKDKKNGDIYSEIIIGLFREDLNIGQIAEKFCKSKNWVYLLKKEAIDIIRTDPNVIAIFKELSS